jgi:hypothetical protein
MRLGPTGLEVSKPPSSGGGGVDSEFWFPPAIANPADQEFKVLPVGWGYYDLNTATPLVPGSGPIDVWVPAGGLVPQVEISARKPSWLLVQPASAAAGLNMLAGAYLATLPATMMWRARIGAWAQGGAAGVSSGPGSIDISCAVLADAAGVSPGAFGNACGLSNEYSGGATLMPYAAYGNFSGRLSASATDPDISRLGGDLEFVVTKFNALYRFFCRGQSGSAYLGQVDWGAGHPFDVGPAWFGIRFFSRSPIWSVLNLPPVFRADYHRTELTRNLLW